MNNIDVTVFLVSLKAGGVALNLTEASRVYLMDSWWNPAVSTLLALPGHASFFYERFQFQVEYRMLCFIERWAKSELVNRGYGSYSSTWSAATCAGYQTCRGGQH